MHYLLFGGIMNDHYKEQKLKAISTLRINIKSLAAESTFIRKEIKRSRNEFVKGCLNSHRTDHVRSESRHTQLSLGAIKGVPYEIIERDAKNEPNWERIKNKVNRHIYLYGPPKKKFEKWLEEAKQYFGGRVKEAA